MCKREEYCITSFERESQCLVSFGSGGIVHLKAGPQFILDEAVIETIDNRFDRFDRFDRILEV